MDASVGCSRGRSAVGIVLLIGFLATMWGCSPPPAKKQNAEKGSVVSKDQSQTKQPERAKQPEKETAPTKQTTQVAAATGHTGAALYKQHCAACHGEQGDGQSRVAVFLYPKPRNFRSGRFKLVSSTNGVTDRDDVAVAIERGMPGSAMPSWAHLSKEDRAMLVDEVLRIFKDAAKEKYVQTLRDQEGMSEEEIGSDETQADIASVVASLTTPQPGPDPPAAGDDVAAAVARGKELYVKQSCHSCHGNEGKGDGVQKQVDDAGTPIRPRDLTRGIYKGGHDVVSLYRRIQCGMPGTPMPSSQNLSPEQMIDLVLFLRSLSTEEQRQGTVMQRRSLPAVAVKNLPSEADDAAWKAVKPTVVQLTPLWWRDEADPTVTVQAAHDGQKLAIRLSWADEFANRAAVGPDEFEDMAAVELYQGAAEPFLGMGAEQAVLDVWQWRAGREATGEADWQMDDYPFASANYRELAKGDVPDFLTARAAGNPLALREHSASSLATKGPGSVTFRPRTSQVVAATATWSDGRWHVVLVRPLDVSAADGLPLAAGAKCSAAFAVWNGGQHDRAGQKLVSIWNDLTIE